MRERGIGISGLHVGSFILFTTLALTMTACLPTVEEQKTMIRKNEIRLRDLSSQAFLDTCGPPAYERRELTQFFVTDSGKYVPRFRVALGDPPAGCNSEVISGEGYFLAYPDRG